MRRVGPVLAAVALLACVAPPGAAASVRNSHNLGSCLACHRETPQFGIDSRRSVSFTTSADDPGLCLPCHPAEQLLHPTLVDAAASGGGTRSSAYLPAGVTGPLAGKIVCTTCHFIHAADGRYGLLRGFPGSPDPRHYASWEEFCVDCHGDGLARRTPHAGGERSCGFCHVSKARAGAAVEVVGRGRGLCLLCHPATRDSHYVNRNPFAERRECLGCHDPHAAARDRPGLLGAAYLAAAADSVVVRPHYSAALCLACHANVDDYALRDEDINALCERCHASGRIRPNIHPLRKVPATIVPPKGWPLADGSLTCLTCHEQGHEDQPRKPNMLRGGPYAKSRDVCAGCHGTGDLLNSRIHEDVNEGKSCELCHRPRPVPGKDTVATVSFIAEPDLLCLRCHDTSIGDGSVHHGAVMGRELAERHLPAELPLYRGRVICATCHNPHLRDGGGHRLREFLSASSFCSDCHKG